MNSVQKILVKKTCKITNNFSNQFDSLQKNLDKKNFPKKGIYKDFSTNFAIQNQSKLLISNSSRIFYW